MSLFKKSKKINKSGIRSILRDYSFSIFCGLLLFYSVGTLNWLQGWLYCGLIFGYQTVSVLFLIFKNPLLLNRRGKIISRDTLIFDIFFVVAYFLLTIIISIVAGLENRNAPNIVNWKIFGMGTILFITSASLGIWAMCVNPFFHVTNIQQAPDKIVCSGPYKYLRHPGYLAWIIGAFSYPLMLNSKYCFIPVSILIVLFVIRTYKEDRFLKQKSKAYINYSRKCKHRLIPTGLVLKIRKGVYAKNNEVNRNILRS